MGTFDAHAHRVNDPGESHLAATNVGASEGRAILAALLHAARIGTRYGCEVLLTSRCAHADLLTAVTFVDACVQDPDTLWQCGSACERCDIDVSCCICIQWVKKAFPCSTARVRAPRYARVPSRSFQGE